MPRAWSRDRSQPVREDRRQASVNLFSASHRGSVRVKRSLPTNLLNESLLFLSLYFVGLRVWRSAQDMTVWKRHCRLGERNYNRVQPRVRGWELERAHLADRQSGASITELNPTNAAAGTGAFTLTVKGSGFVSNSVVRWKGTARTTTFVDGKRLTAVIDSGDVAEA